MTHTNRISMEQWTMPWALMLAAACLMAGIAGGWLMREWKSSAIAASTQAAPTSAQGPKAPAPPASDPAQVKAMADAEAAPMLVRLQSDPNNPELLTSVGNLYYDAQQYPTAVDYYERALKSKPSDTAVRTDMGTAYWFMGKADAAIAAFNQALTYEPNNPNTLFNRGLVRWQGKTDAAGAVADWEKLLASNPNYAGKDKVEQLIAEVEKHTASARN
jgi:tetratricopeptide (TPR) repeat protein